MIEFKNNGLAEAVRSSVCEAGATVVAVEEAEKITEEADR